MPLHPLSNFQIQIYYQIELKIKSAYARNNSPEISDGAYVKNLKNIDKKRIISLKK